MNELSINLEEEVKIWQERLFKRSIRRRRKLERISEITGNTANMQCLEICVGDGIISRELRELGGSWKTAVVHQEELNSLRITTNESITLITDGKLPFEDGAFDRVVIIDALKGVDKDHDFIHECHRVLNANGWVVINETLRKPLSPSGILRRLLGITPTARGGSRNGYRAHELFNILKDGFDVPSTVTYSNGLLEASVVIGEFIQHKLLDDYYWRVKKTPGKDLLYRYRRLNSLAQFAAPILWIIAQMEFFPGHQLLVKSRRRQWRPRLQPKLIDGRSIAEAAINTKIGTAAPF